MHHVIAGTQLFNNVHLNPWVILAIKVVVILSFVPVAALTGGYALHKVMAHLQHRVGPMYAGAFHGWAQTLADGIKFIYKEDIIPAAADKRVFKLAPIMVFVPILMLYLVIPVDKRLVVENIDVGVFYLLAIGSVSTIGVLMAGWSSANKYSLIGALRAAGQLLAYELPFVLTVASVAMYAGTLSVTGIVEKQHWPLIIWPPGLGLIAFLIFFAGATAEMTVPPFDMPVAESEIITGPFTEYTGMRFIFGVFFAEMGHMIAFSGIATALFLGGYRPIVPAPGLDKVPGVIWFFAKLCFVVFLFLWVRPTFPRLREDQLQRFAWKVLIPLSLVLVLGMGAWVLYA
ncbi:MAG: NADH-quinone oxidoreductase subunit H [Actinomycetota bacterium]|nr:NADH-quinone oxidoreductase subunit H [Actinomycetota bacterium]